MTTGSSSCHQWLKLRGKLPCPVCGKPLHFSILEKVDFVGEGVTLFAFSCECGYRGADTFPEKTHGPRRLVYRVGSLNTLVARSSTATVRIPEIGAEIKPGPAATGYITTVEGILRRIRERFPQEKKVDELLAGRPFTLVLDDPNGASAIDSGDVEIIALNDKNAFKP